MIFVSFSSSTRLLEMGVGKRVRNGCDLDLERRACVQKLSSLEDVEKESTVEGAESVVAFAGEGHDPGHVKLQTVIPVDCGCTEEHVCESHHVDAIKEEDLALQVAVEDVYGFAEVEVDDDLWFEGSERSLSEGACSPFDVGDSGSEVDSDMYAPASWSDF